MEMVNAMHECKAVVGYLRNDEETKTKWNKEVCIWMSMCVHIGCDQIYEELEQKISKLCKICMNTLCLNGKYEMGFKWELMKWI